MTNKDKLIAILGYNAVVNFLAFMGYLPPSYWSLGFFVLLASAIYSFVLIYKTYLNKK